MNWFRRRVPAIQCRNGWRRSDTFPTRSNRCISLESLETREVFAADTLPVLMVLADKQDFYYREYAETRQAIEANGIEVVVAATTTDTTYPHPGSGQQNSTGAVQPDLPLSEVDPDHYSAIVFVGGWGSSMYQYAYNDANFDGTLDNYYAHGPYNGDDNLHDGVVAAQKVIVNNLINDFLAGDKHVGAICHGVTVLAWARVDGVSPIHGRNVAVPTTVSSPDQFYDDEWRNGGYMLGQYDQIIANGGVASAVSGSIGDPGTSADDVVVDGRIITAENFESSYYFGEIVASEVLANNSTPSVRVVGDDLVVVGHAEEPNTIYVWSTGPNHVGVWLNGVEYPSIEIGAGGHVRVFGGNNNDSIFATDLYQEANVFGGDGNDLLVGGHGHDNIDGGAGVDRVTGGPGDDILRGGAGNDFLFGGKGNNIMLGGTGTDVLYGGEEHDILIGGAGSDYVFGNGGSDILIGGTTSYDEDEVALRELQAVWTAPGKLRTRVLELSDSTRPYHLRTGVGGTVHNDNRPDALVGGTAADWYFAGIADFLLGVDDEDRVD